MQRWGALLVVGVLGVGTGAADPGSRLGDGARREAHTSATAEAARDVSPELPVLGTFQYDHFGKSSGTRVVGAVHGVQRVEGGTVVYYSVGVPSGEPKDLSANLAFEPSTIPYKLENAAHVTLVDVGNLVAYRPLVDDDGGLTSRYLGFTAPAGTLLVAFAVFPELAADVSTVDLQFEWGATVSGVPVGDGDLEPQVRTTPVPLGEGWPELPSSRRIAAADPAAVTFPLVARTGDAAGATETSETSEEVEVTLGADFFFDTGSWALKDGTAARIDEIAADVSARAAGEVVVIGHTDSVPDSDVGNQQLSENRAEAVAALLREAVGNDVELSVQGRGESEPVASNSTDEGRAQNRRVTVTYQVEGQS
ncbi:MAG: OmpA family protein [Cellulomonadaceae bacterium]